MEAHKAPGRAERRKGIGQRSLCAARPCVCVHHTHTCHTLTMDTHTELGFPLTHALPDQGRPRRCEARDWTCFLDGPFEGHTQTFPVESKVVGQVVMWAPFWPGEIPLYPDEKSEGQGGPGLPKITQLT